MKLTPDIIDHIKKTDANGYYTLDTMAKMFGVSSWTIRKLRQFNYSHAELKKWYREDYLRRRNSKNTNTYREKLHKVKKLGYKSAAEYISKHGKTKFEKL